MGGLIETHRTKVAKVHKTLSLFAFLVFYMLSSLLPGTSLADAQGQTQGQTAAVPHTIQPSGPSGMPRDNGVHESYRLGTGDKVKITVFGQTDLSGEFVVDDQGIMQLPLIGQVKAAGLTISDFQRSVTSKFADGYLRDPRVSVEVINYRPVYIIGEVNKPGEYPYVNGMSILNAVALAGGYTYRADETIVHIQRNGTGAEVKYPADDTTIIYPGDIIRVTERFF